MGLPADRPAPPLRACELPATEPGPVMGAGLGPDVVHEAYGVATAPGSSWHAPAHWPLGSHGREDTASVSRALRAQRQGGSDAREAARERRRAVVGTEMPDMTSLAVALEAEAAAVVVGGLTGRSPGGSSSGAPRAGGGRPLVVVDVRCLQTGEYDTRGVGKHALGVLRTLTGVVEADPRRPAVVGLADPTAGRLSPTARDLLARVVAHAADVPLADVLAFVSLSPMTADSMVVAPFLTAPWVRSAAVVYDLVPYRAPWRYLPDETDRCAYEARLLALHAYDRVLPISRSTAVDLVGLAGLATARLAVTGVADPLGEPLRAGGLAATATPSRYALAATGADPRKDLPCAVAAYAAARSRGVDLSRLVVVGRLSGPQQDGARALGEELGLDPAELDLRSDLTDDELGTLYARAAVALVTSVDEGFSLPVAEAVRRGTPVVASDIAPHRELLGDGPWLARRRDPCAGADALVAVLADRQRVLDRQQEALGALASPAAVEARVAAEVLALLEPGSRGAFPDPAGTAPRRPRVVVVTPWRPQVSGISDFSAATVEAMRRIADVSVSTEAEDPAPSPVPVHRLTVEPYLDPSVDAVVSVLGNSLLHVTMLELVRAFGGPVLAHDSRLFEVYLASRGWEATTVMISEPGHPLGLEAFHRALVAPDLLPRLGFAQVSPHARPLVVHSEPLAERLGREGPATPVVVPFVPYTVPEGIVDEHRVRDARERLGLGDEVVVASFGLVDVRTKGADHLVAAVRWCEVWGAEPALHLIGPVADAERIQLTDTARRLGLSQPPVFHGHVAREDLQTWLLAVDVAVQLRRLRLGVSGALADCVAHGVPTVATAGIAEELDAPSYVVRVPHETTPLLLAEHLMPQLRPRTGRTAEVETERRSYLERRNMTAYAQELMLAVTGRHGGWHTS